MTARVDVREVAEEDGEWCEWPHFLEHVCIDEHVVVRARVRDGIERVLHLPGGDARIDPLPGAIERQRYDASAGSR